MGTYTGNGNADGTFVYLGFRPAFLLWRYSAGSASWTMTDNTRSTYNLTTGQLYANASTAETQYTDVDFLSNGFKIRETDTARNTSGGEHIYLAFAETPFKYSNAK